MAGLFFYLITVPPVQPPSSDKGQPNKGHFAAYWLKVTWARPFNTNSSLLKSFEITEISRQIQKFLASGLIGAWILKASRPRCFKMSSKNFKLLKSQSWMASRARESGWASFVEMQYPRMGCQDMLDAFDWSVFFRICRRKNIKICTTFCVEFSKSDIWNSWRQLAKTERVEVADRCEVAESGKSWKISLAIVCQIGPVEGAVLIIEWTMPGRVKILVTIRSFLADDRDGYWFGVRTSDPVFRKYQGTHIKGALIRPSTFWAVWPYSQALAR